VYGAPWVNRTPEFGLQNRRFTTRTNRACLGDPGRDRTASYPVLETGAPPFMRLGHMFGTPPGIRTRAVPARPASLHAL
jgi:hypothetical protein